jgi:hypothetical protein
MSRATLASERRNERRQRPLKLIYVELSSANGGMMRDISETGFAMRAMMPLRAGEVTPFAFSLNPSTRLEGKCKILWVEENGRVAGMQFTEVPRILRTQIRDWLEEQENPEPAAVETPQAAKNSTMEQLREELRAVPARSEIAENLTAQEIPAIEAEPVPRFRSEMNATEESINLVPAAAAGEPTRVPSRREISAAADIQTVAPEIPREAAEGRLRSTIPVLEHLPSEYRDYRPRAGRLKASVGARIMLLVGLLAAGVFFHREVGNAIVWLGLRISGTSAPEVSPVSINEAVPAIAPPSTPADNPVVPLEKEHKDVAASAKKNQADTADTTENVFSAPAKHPSPGSPAAMLPVARSASPAVTSVPGVEAGQLEFQTAQDILNRNIDASLPEAVRLLWVAVERGNANAEVALAELYRVGKGVSRNCDQTKILLTAAVRKGNAQARKMLDQFEGESCE